MATKKIQPKQPAEAKKAAGSRKAEKTSAKKVTSRKLRKTVAKKQSARKAR
jgi:hypothetical protein